MKSKVDVMRVLVGIALAVSVCLAAPASRILYLAGGHHADGLNSTYRIGDADPRVVTAQVNSNLGSVAFSFVSSAAWLKVSAYASTQVTNSAREGTDGCIVSSFETQPKGTLRHSLRFSWQRSPSVSEWFWQEKRKRVLLESNPPGIFRRRLIPMSAGEGALVARVYKELCKRSPRE